ncbi:MAG: hypothetical protein ACFFC7_20155 [Candidatus Hermodarchaeota archaeon]
MGQSLTHYKLKHKWYEKLTNQGYTCTFEKKLNDPDNPKNWVKVDLYAENEQEIVIVEVIKTSWSGKDPRHYLKTRKKVRFVRQWAITEQKAAKKNPTIVTYNFTIDSRLKKRVEEYCKKRKINKTRFIIEAIREKLGDPKEIEFLQLLYKSARHPNIDIDEFENVLHRDKEYKQVIIELLDMGERALELDGLTKTMIEFIQDIAKNDGIAENQIERFVKTTMNYVFRISVFTEMLGKWLLKSLAANNRIIEYIAPEYLLDEETAAKRRDEINAIQKLNGKQFLLE